MGSHGGYSGSAGTQWGLWSLKVRRFLGRSFPVWLTGIHRPHSAGGLHICPQLPVLKQLCCPLLQGPQGGTFLPSVCSFCIRRRSNPEDQVM